MVTPTNGTATFRGVSGKVYNTTLYIADAVGTAVKFSQQGKAGTGDLPYFRAPENCYFVGASILTGPTVIFSLVPTRDGGTVPGSVVSVADNLNTLAYRPVYNVPIRAGTLFGFLEV